MSVNRIVKTTYSLDGGSPFLKDQYVETSLHPIEDRAGTRLRQALERLSASGREVIHLHYFSGLSYKEIAQTLGISSQAVHGRMQRARRILARRLSERDE